MQRIRHEDHTKNETMLVSALQIKTVLWKCKKFAEEKVRKGVRVQSSEILPSCGLLVRI